MFCLQHGISTGKCAARSLGWGNSGIYHTSASQAHAEPPRPGSRLASALRRLAASIRAGLEQVKVGLAESIGEVKQGSLSRGHGNFPTAVASTTAPQSHLSPESAEGALLREEGADWKAVHLLGLCWNSSSSHSFPNTLSTAPWLIRNCS